MMVIYEFRFDILINIILQPRFVGIHHDQITAMCLSKGVIIEKNIKSNPAMMDTLLHAIVAFSDAR